MIMSCLNIPSQGPIQSLVILDELLRFELIWFFLIYFNILEISFSVFNVLIFETAHRRRIQNHNARVLHS